MRQAARQIRGTPGAAFRASWNAYLVGPFALALGVSLFLGFVGAFDTLQAPLGWRLLTFLLLGLGSAALVSLSLWASDRIAWFGPRPILRRLARSAFHAPLTALWIWAAVGFAFVRGGPRLGDLPVYLGYALVMSLAMSALAWAVFRKRGAAVIAEPASPPRFLDRLPFRLRDAELYAIEADDHYLRVRTSKGADLILMRMSDALAELQSVEGAQTHRSWWVAKAAVADVARRQGKPVVVLKDGTEAPISRTYAPTLRAAGWL